MLLPILALSSTTEAGLLGAGTGDGSCAASPYRAAEAELAWPEGCPEWAACCTEYGYCHPRVSSLVDTRIFKSRYYFVLYIELTYLPTDYAFRKAGRLNCSATVTVRVTG